MTTSLVQATKVSAPPRGGLRYIPTVAFGTDLVIVLTLTGLKMLGVPPEWVGLIGAALLLLGPLVWGFLRQRRGLPAFDNNAAAWRVPD